MFRDWQEGRFGMPPGYDRTGFCGEVNHRSSREGKEAELDPLGNKPRSPDPNNPDNPED